MTDPQVIVNLGTGGSDLNGQNGSTSSADSNDARFLDWPGDNAGNYVYLPGVDGNAMTVPHEAALDITGDIDIRIYASLDWQGTTQAWLVSKATVFSQETFSFYKHTVAGQFRFECGDGSSSPAVTSAAVSFSDGDAGWIRVTRDQTGGEVKFYESTDGASWTLLNTVTGFTTTAGFSNSINVAIGSRATSTLSSAIEAKVYRAQILDGIDGTTVLDIDTSVITSGSATSFTATTGQTVTINRSTSGRKSVAVVSPVWLFGTDDYMEVADNALIDFGDNEEITGLAAIRVWSTAATNGVIFDKKSGLSGGLPGYQLFLKTDPLPAGVVSDGVTQDADDGPSFSYGDLVVVGLRRDATTISALTDTDSETAVDDTTDISNALALSIGRRTGAGTYQDFELIGFSLFRRALTATEIQSVVTYYQNRLS